MADVIEIDGEQALALLKRAVEEKGADYRYPMGANCSYQRYGAPSCIVGHALAYVGVPVEKLAALDDADETFKYKAYSWYAESEVETTPGSTAVDVLNDCGALEAIAGVRLTDTAERIFQTAQNNQDQRISWGDSVEAAEETA